MKPLRLVIPLAALALVAGVISGAALAAPPANDDFANATTIGSLPFSDTASVGGATTEAGEPFICTFLPQTVWYRYQPLTSGYVKLGLTSDVSDGFLQIFSGSSFDNLLPFGCLPSAQAEQFLFVQAGFTYYFQVGTQIAETANVTLSVEQPKAPTNDDFGNATPVDSPLLEDFVDMSKATVSSDDPTDCFSGLNSVWYTVTPAADTKIGVTSSLGQPGFSIYTGSRGSLHLIGCGGPQTFDAKKGVTYYIEVLFDDVTQVVIGDAFRMTALSVSPVGRLDRATNAATITGTFACNMTSSALVTVDLTQQRPPRPTHRQRTVHGRGSAQPLCSKAGSTWSVSVLPDQGQFAPGPATVTVTASGGGIPPFYNGDSKTVTATVLLR